MIMSKGRNPWAVILIGMVCLWSLNYTEGLRRVSQLNYDALLSSFGFNAQALTGALDNQNFGGILTAGMQTVTYQFLHVSLPHFSWNMFFLFCLGMRVERYLGGVVFLAFYLAAGIVGALVMWVLDFDTAVPLIGASGAISGCIGAYAALVLHTRGRKEPWAWLGMLVVLRFVYVQFQLVVGDVPASAGNVTIAYATHLVGMAFGYAVLYLSIRANRRPVITPVRIEPNFFEFDEGFERYAQRR